MATTTLDMEAYGRHGNGVIGTLKARITWPGRWDGSPEQVIEILNLFPEFVTFARPFIRTA